MHYLPGGALLIATGNTETLYYGYYDRLGSLVALTNASCTVVERYAYDPWGNRRNPTNWTQADSRTSWIVNRGFTMHEHLDAFGIINMNGRVYDPLMAQFFSPDPYVQAPGDWLNYNRYSYCLNNPFKYTDPSGEFLGLVARGLAFIGRLSSNLIHGVNDPAGHAWKQSGSVTNEMGSCLQFPVYQNDNTLITAGLDPFSLGVSVNSVHKSGNATFSGSAGFGLLGGWFANGGVSYSAGDWIFGAGAGVGNNYWGWNVRAGHEIFSLGYGQTYYGNAIGSDGQSNAQTVGSATIFWKGGSFRLENDFLAGNGDRWRTNAWELTIGDFSIGSYVYTNDGKAESELVAEETGLNAKDPTCLSKIWGKNRGDKFSTWTYGETFSAPMWVGYRVGNQISRIGYSFPGSQDLQQNGIHKWVSFGRQNFYTGYSNFRTGLYLNSGYYNPFFLWGY
jgi:RHS repeat-associated protein